MEDEANTSLHDRIEALDKERHTLRAALLHVWQRERSLDHARHPDLSKNAWEHVEQALSETRRRNEKE